MNEVAEILGIAPGEMESMPPERARNLIYTINKLLEGFEDELSGEIFEAAIPSSMVAVQSAHARAMAKLANSLKSGKIGLDGFNRGAHNSISKSFRRSYSMGLGGGKLGAGDTEWLRRATDAEFGYARKFGEDVQAGKGISIARRSQMYGATLQGAYWNAWVEKLPDGARITWKLGKAEHCDDCIILSQNSPYLKTSLPTTPKAGATACRSNCRCKLVARGGKLSRKEKRATQGLSVNKDQSLADLLGMGPIPQGMRLASDAERIYIDGLWNKINYNRRLIGTSKNARDVDAAIRARKLANVELIEFLEQNGIYEVPAWSVDEVVTGQHLGLKAEADIFRAGMDGETLALLSQSEIDAMVRGYGSELGALKEADQPLPDEDTPFFERGAEEYTLIAPTLKGTMLLAAEALKAARGLRVQVGPFEDKLLTRTYVWIRGPREDLETVLDKIEGKFVAVPVEILRRRT